MMPSNKHNLITTKATGLSFSLFDVALAREVPFGILQFYSSWTYQCVPFIFADSKKCQFGSST